MDRSLEAYAKAKKPAAMKKATVTKKSSKAQPAKKSKLSGKQQQKSSPMKKAGQKQQKKYSLPKKKKVQQKGGNSKQQTGRRQQQQRQPQARRHADGGVKLGVAPPMITPRTQAGRNAGNNNAGNKSRNNNNNNNNNGGNRNNSNNTGNGQRAARPMQLESKQTPVPAGHTAIVHGIPVDVCANQIRDAFAQQCGAIESYSFSRGIATFIFESKDGAARVKSQYDGGVLNGNKLTATVV